MNRILFEELQKTYQLDPRDPRFEHVRGVLRMQKGDQFDVGVINGPVGKAVIISLDGESLDLEVEWGERPPLPPDITLLVGLCRPATARKILSTAPTLGIRALDFVASGRSDPAYGKSGIWKDGSWRARLVEGVEQSFDTYVPDVRRSASLEESLHGLPGGCQKLALDVYESTRKLSDVSLTGAESVALAIGPERGWNVNDRKILLDGGFELVALSERVLRVETAVTVGLALLLEKLGIY